jgi:hypothetical protein
MKTILNYYISIKRDKKDIQLKTIIVVNINCAKRDNMHIHLQLKMINNSLKSLKSKAIRFYST